MPFSVGSSWLRSIDGPADWTTSELTTVVDIPTMGLASRHLDFALGPSSSLTLPGNTDPSEAEGHHLALGPSIEIEEL